MTSFIIILIVILVILYVHHKAYLEPFADTPIIPNKPNTPIIPNKPNTPNTPNTNDPTTLLIFVSKSCVACKNYNKNYHDTIVELAKKKGVQVKRIFSDEDPEHLFDKFKVMYVPTCFVMKGDKILKNLGSNVNPQSIQSALA